MVWMVEMKMIESNCLLTHLPKIFALLHRDMSHAKENYTITNVSRNLNQTQ